MPAPALLNLLSSGSTGPDTWVPPISGYYMLCDMSNTFTVTSTSLGGGSYAVDQVSDQSANTKHLTATSTARPTGFTTIGTRQAATWDGTSDSMTAYVALPNPTISGGHTVFIVCDITSTTTKVLLEHSPNWNTNNGMIMNPDSSSQMTYGIRRSSSNSAYSYSTTTTGAHVWTFRADGTHANQVMRKDGSAVTGTSYGAGYNNNVGTGNVTDTLLVGSRNNGSLFIAMKWGLLLIYNSTLSNGDCSTTEASLKAWFGTP